MVGIKESLNNYLSNPNVVTLYKLAEYMMGLEFTQKDLKTTSRVLLHWYREKLLTYEEKDSKNHRFDIFELFWLWIIEDLRTFGYSIPKIRKVKEELMTTFTIKDFFKNHTYEEMAEIAISQYNLEIEQSGINKKEFRDRLRHEFEDSNSEFVQRERPYISLPIFEFLQDRRDILFLFDQQGKVSVIYRDQYGFGENNELFNEAFISLPLIRYFSRLLSDWKYISFLSEIKFISEIEQQALALILKDKVQSVTFKFKDGIPNIIEISQDKKIESLSQITKLFAKKEYQDILLKTQDGNITYANIKTKHKLGL
ncbi:MAG: hypothetical protein K8R63_12820 [Bacteroidales bacterium]|nr:hypothetical protein [Bacteroidales bacterium]